jgi:type VI secretion system protein
MKPGRRCTGRFAANAPLVGALALAIAGGVGLAACSSVSRTICLDPDGPKRVSITAGDRANLDRAVAVALVFVTDEALAAEIVKLSARDYFARQAQLMRDYPGGLRVTSWELTPGQSVSDQPIDAPCAAQAVLVFVDYATPGEHRLRLDGVSRLTLVLGASDFTAGTG